MLSWPSLYERLRRSRPADFYRWLRYPQHRRSVAHERRLLGQLVRPGALIFDLGANRGAKTACFLRLEARKVVALEPDPACAEILKRRFRRNRRVELVFAAVADRSGGATLFMAGEGNAFNTLSDKWTATLGDVSRTRFGDPISFDSSRQVTTVTLDDLCERFGTPDVVKIDVEGYEYKALQGLSRPIPLLWFENNLPEFLDEAVQCVEHLIGLSPSYEFNYLTDATENPASQFRLERWVDGASMLSELRRTASRFVEVFARLGTTRP